MAEKGEIDEALRVANEVLNEDFNNPRALFIIGYVLLKAERFGLAYNINKIVTQMAPNRAEPWNNMGMCHQETLNLDDAERCFRQSLKIEPGSKAAMNNMALIYVNRGQPEAALQWSEKALKIDPAMKDAQDNKGLACLMLGKWAEGWKNWEASLGGPQRREIVYGSEPRWDGSRGKTVVVYGEQGLGDEIAFASCIPDAIRDCKKVVIDCDHRLAGLFKRSFPQADVYGTRFQKEVGWPAKYQIDARCAMGGLPKFYRNRDEDFPRAPYLIPDPERRIQWKALLESLGPGMKIGFAYTGGLLSTGAKKRSLDLDQLLPLLKQEAHWVSLQYRDPPDCEAFFRDHGIRLHHWRRGTQTDDYDDTAALVAELDLVITVTTTVVHLCGAIGTPCWVLTPKHPPWFFGLGREDMQWYSCVRLFRQKTDWDEVVRRIAKELHVVVAKQRQAGQSEASPVLNAA